MKIGYLGLIAAALMTGALCSSGASQPGTVIRFNSLDLKHHYAVSGTLYTPADATAPVPAVVMVHGTMGIDSRGDYYRGPILDAGIAVFEVDFKSGIYHSPLDRPSPETFLGMGFAALKELRKIPAIDPDRIGIMGFSLGGHLTVEAAFDANRAAWMGSDKGFATHVAFYPVSRRFLSRDDLKVTGAPMLILYGTEDSYGDGTNVAALKALLMQKDRFEILTVEYPGASHGFNMNEPPKRYFDPAAIGHRGHTEYDPAATSDSLPRVVDFLRRTLHAGQP